MSLSARDRHALNAIREGLAGSDPDLASFLGTFSRLTAGEEMPSREQIRARWHPIEGTGRHTARRGTRWLGRRVGPAGIMMLAWLMIAVTLVSLAVVLSRGGPATCKMSWSMGCTVPTPSASVHAGQP